MATLTYSYVDSTVVVGPISVYAEPHTYDLCGDHADSVNAPRGWEVLRLDYERKSPDDDGDLLALADAVRDQPEPEAPAARQAPQKLTPPEGASSGVSRGNLHLLR